MDTQSHANTDFAAADSDAEVQDQTPAPASVAVTLVPEETDNLRLAEEIYKELQSIGYAGL
jgi:hypothetical protein